MTNNIWGVTATPFEAMPQICRELGFGDHGGQYMNGGWGRGSWTQPNNLYAQTWKRITETMRPTSRQIDLMNTIIIRHTKEQQINGAAALKLPPMPRKTIVVQTTAQEKQAYLDARNAFDILNCASHVISINNANGNTAHHLVGSASWFDKKLQPIRSRTLCRSKLIALEKDIEQLLKKEPSGNVLIFTRYKSSIQMLKHFAQGSAVMSEMELYELSPSAVAKDRHDAIESFQNPKNTQPKILIISYKTGQCGVTLTAASRVYLLEPCLLPSDEVQAAGRISRVGQTKKIILCRFVAESTCDEGLIKFHKMLEDGAAKLDSKGHLPPVLLPMLLKEGSLDPPQKNNCVHSHYGPLWPAIYKVGFEALSIHDQTRFNRANYSRMVDKLHLHVNVVRPVNRYTY